MYYALAVAGGAMIALMVALNGGLTTQYGMYTATVIIHIVGLIAISLIAAVKREKIFHGKKLPLYMYAGGVLGVATTVFNNMAVTVIGVAGMLAISLIGQSIMAVIIDSFGLFGMKKRPFNAGKLIGLFIAAAGAVLILVLSGESITLMAVPVIVSVLSGVTVALTRVTNGRLSDETSVTVSTFYNYVTGLIVSVAVMLLIGRGEAPFTGFSGSFFIYLGGLCGVAVIVLSNLTVTRLSSFYVTLLMFVGQVFAGMIIDALTRGDFSAGKLAGGLLVAAGLALNVWLDKRRQTT